MEGTASTMDSISDQHTFEPKAPMISGGSAPPDTGLAPKSRQPLSEEAPGDESGDCSAPRLRVIPEEESASSTPNTEAFDTGEDRIDQTVPDAERASDEASEPSAAAVEPIEIHPHRVVEAILFAADSPMPPAKIASVLGVGDARDVRKHIERLNAEYASQGLAFRIEELAGGYQMLTLPAYNSWLRKLLRARQETRLSPAALETLAILAYKQPCTRAEVEAIRGVAAGDLINRLREMNLVKIVGRAEDLGRPLLYGTTKRFLEVFGLPSLEELPQVETLNGGSNGAVRESAKMPAAALAKGTVERHRSVEELRDTPEISDASPEKASSAVEESSAPVTAMLQDTAPPGEQVSEQ